MKLLIDQLGYAFLFNFMYLAVIRILETGNLKEVQKNVRDNFMTLMKLTWKIEPFIAILNF